MDSVTANDLTYEFTNNIDYANEIFLNKKLKITGEVKAIYKLLNARLVMEFSVSNEELPIISFFKNKTDEFEAQKLRERDMVTVTGVCLGTSAYSYIKGIKIDVESFNKE